MSIVNRRNALVGYVVTKVAKRVGRKKASSTVPGGKTGGAAVGVVAAVVGALVFWRKTRSSDDGE